MTKGEGARSREQRLGRLRSDWRRADDVQGSEARGQRRNDTLGSSDRIRAEAPDDLETRRRADQLEREIKRPPRRTAFDDSSGR